MSYLKFAYILIVVALVFVYNLTPKKIKPLVLLAASFVFFAYISRELIVFLCLSILSVYIGGRVINRIDTKKEKLVQELKDKEEKKKIKNKYKRRKKLVLVLIILFNLSFLVYYKYLNFFGTNIDMLLSKFNLDIDFKVVKHIAPIGISYYTLQAIAYITDVYNEKIKADKNILRMALFMSFFPQIMEGPIARYSDTTEDLYKREKVTKDNFSKGILRMLYGMFKKLIVADRLNGIVKVVFSNHMMFGSFSTFISIAAYTVMLYMEFSGTMDVVVGTGEIFGVKIPENFRQPFFSKNISEFWTRWHISLGTWFKDYIFYPVSLSKPMKKLTIKARKFLGNHFGPLISGAVALFSVWFLNGLWHGAGYTYIFFGLYHFTMILLGNIFTPTVIKICAKLHINRANIFYRIFQSVKMTILIFFGELFFRAPTMEVGISMFKRIFSHIKTTSEQYISFGLDYKDFIVLIIGIIVVFVISLLREKNVDIRAKFLEKKTFTRWAILIAVIVIIFIFGAYGKGYVPVDPIYADF